MESTNSRFIILIVSIIIALTTVVFVLFNINKDNELHIPAQMPIDDIQYIFASDSYNKACKSFEFKHISTSLRNNIIDFDELLAVLLHIKDNSACDSNTFNSPAFFSTYTSGGWMIFVKTKEALSVPSGYTCGISNGYFYACPVEFNNIHSAEIENNLLAIKEKNHISDIMLSHDSHSDLFVVEKISEQESMSWICHDIYFSSHIKVFSFYKNINLNTRMIKDNPSKFIQSFRNCGADYRFANKNNSSSSYLSVHLSNLGDKPYKPQIVVEKVEEESKEKDRKEERERKKDKKEEKKIEEEIVSTNVLLYGPSVVESHKEEGGFFTQTKDKNLHFNGFDNTEKWKITIDSEIIGDIVEVDWYKNNKIQYLFNTATRIYLVDVLGNIVKPFPLTLPVKTQNQVAVYQTNSNDFNIYYNGIDEAFYYTSYKNNDYIVEMKKEKFGAVTTPYYIIYNKKTPYIVIQKDDKSIDILRTSGSLHLQLSAAAANNIESPIYINHTNSKGSFLTSNNNGEVLYFDKNGATATTKLLSEQKPATLYYKDFPNETYNFFYIYDHKFEVISPARKTIFSLDLNITPPYKTVMKQFDNQLAFVIFSDKDKKANVVRYFKNSDYSNKEYNSQNMPSINKNNVFFVDDKGNVSGEN